MLATIETARIREGASALAREAGQLLLEGFRKAPVARVKGAGGDLCTEYDERCEALLRSRLAELTPEAAFVGEEGGGAPGAGLAWHVDPIDGTSNFAHGHPYFAISMGLWSASEPLVGIVHAPAMHLTFTAGLGAGADRNGEPIHVSSTERLEEALLATGFPYDRGTNPRNNYREFVTLDARSHGVRRCAAASLELALVADGGYDGFWDRGLASWDVAAAVLLIREAGGRVTDLEGADFALTPRVEILASNGALHGPLQRELAHARASLPVIPVT